jgi:hypothetical protein
MINVLLAIGTVVGGVALAIACLWIREPNLASFSTLALGGAPQAVTPELSAKPRPATASAADQVERFSARRVGLAARQLVAEVEEYLADQANSR